MRDPKRIKPFLKRLEKAWTGKCSDMRFGQLVVCILNSDNSFYIEDDIALAKINAWIMSMEHGE